MKITKTLTLIFILTFFYVLNIQSEEVDHFLNIVGIDCEKANNEMRFEEVDAIRECLDTQIEYAGKSWDKLIAEGKVVPSPSLKANAQKLNTKKRI